MAKVLVSDNLAPQGLEVLRQSRGIELIEKPGASAAELLELIPDVEGLVIRSGTKVTADVIEAAVTDHVETQARLTSGLSESEVRRLDRLLAKFLGSLEDTDD